MATLTPALLIQRHLDAVFGHLPGIFDGNVESVHQARVATRRLREVLPLTVDSHTQGIVETVRSAGRQLGRVRELDVMSSLLDAVSSRMVATAGVAAMAKRVVLDRQRTERRAMVKALERLDLDMLRDVFADRRSLAVWSRTMRLVRAPEWVEPLWSRIASRSVDTVDAVRRAPGIYFPKRSHRARVAVKKLRYAVETAADTGVWQPHKLLKDLRRIQGTLGDMHDAQVLADALDDLVPDHKESADLISLKGLLADDIARQQIEYTSRRDRIFAIADVCTRAAARARAVWRPRRTVVAVSVIAAPLLLLGRRHTG